MIGNESVQQGTELGLSMLPIVGGPLGTIFENQENARLTKENRDYNLRLWNMNNEYNSPSAQMQRMKAAGLNPNLMYTQGSVGNASAPSASSPVHYNRPKADWGEVMQAMEMFADLKLKDAQTQKEIAQTKNELQKFNILDEQGYALKMENYFNWSGDTERFFNMHSLGKYQNAFTEKWLANILNKKSSTSLNEALLRIRGQEADLNETLKPLGFTTSDPAWIRFLANLATKSGMLKKFFGNYMKQY